MIRWALRGLLVLALLLGALLAPVGYSELACQSDVAPDTYTPILPPEHHRAESRTLLTYPEWHIVHAYDDYAKVISQGDPHDFGFLSAIAGYWRTLCGLSKEAGAHGGIPWETRQMVYVIGVSFTAELALKAAYEETLGRAFVALRGPEHAPLDALSARQARDYATFLQQVPWYRWDFRGDRAALNAAATGALRDRERRLALGLEYGAKALYAKGIEQAVAGVGADALRLRMVVRGADTALLARMDSVQVISTRPQGVEIETPRYRDLTRLLERMAAEGADFVEIAGNDDIMLTALSDAPRVDGAFLSFARQGHGDWRHLLRVRVSDLADSLRGLSGRGLRLEHVHDY